TRRGGPPPGGPPQLFDLGGLELTPGAGLEAGDGERPVAAPVQVEDGVADRLEHPPYLAVPALVDRQLDSVRAAARHDRRSGRAVVELDPGGEAEQRRIVR